MPNDKKDGSQFCSNCGLQIVKPSAPGSITGYMFDPVRCKCTAEGGSTPTLKPASPGYQTFAGVGSQGASEMHLDEGALVGGSYSIIGLIGAGGMGVVYGARHVALGKRCAIKLIPPDQVTSMAWSRFQLEAKSVAKLDHKNIVKVTDLGLHKGYMPFYAMELINGQTLADKLAKSGHLELQEALSIFIQVCDGVDYAHRAGIIHRDLKPANIMLSSDGVVKILDFGLAKLAHQNRAEQSLTSVGDIFGSPFYMSPEQCAGEKIDNRSDIYSLGCALFECLTGRPPFEGNLAASIMFAQQESRPPSIESVLGKNKMPESIEIILAKLLRKNPVERYQTCRELSVDLERVRDGKGVEPVYVSRLAKVKATAPANNINPEPEMLQKSLLLTVSAVVVLLIATAAGASYFLGQKPALRAAGPNDIKVVDGKADEVYKDVYENVENRGSHLYVGELPNEKKYFSAAESNNQKLKTYFFPKDIHIGMIGGDDNANLVAAGTLVLPVKNLCFRPEIAAITAPSYFSRFRAGEVSTLQFSGSNLDASEANDSEDADINKCCTAITYLPGWQNLTRLIFHALSGKLDATSLKTLSSLRALKSLDLGGVHTDCLTFSKLPLIKTLEVVGLNKVPDYLTLLKSLKNSPKLTTLYIDRIDFSEPELAALAAIPDLQYISFDGDAAPAKFVARLAAIKKLSTLSMSYKDFQRLDVQQALRQIHSLRHLYVVRVSTKDSNWLPYLKSRLPGVAIEFNVSNGYADGTDSTHE